MHIPPGYANATYEFSQQTTNQQAMTSIGLQLEAADPSDVIDGLAATWLDNIGTSVSDTWVGDTIRLTIGTSDPSAPIVIERQLEDLNGNTSDCLPPNVAWLIRKFTLSGGRKGRGRMYIPGVAESAVDDAGNFSTSQHAFQVAAVDTYLTQLRNIDGVAGVYLFHTDPADDPSEIVGLVSERMVATQRRRLRG